MYILSAKEILRYSFIAPEIKYFVPHAIFIQVKGVDTFWDSQLVLIGFFFPPFFIYYVFL